MKKKIRLMWAVFTAACVFFCGCGDDGERILLEQALLQQAAQGAAAAEAAPETGGKNTEEQTAPEEKKDTVWVHICGEVREPGVYELEAGSRVCDALLAAGGFTQEADPDFHNLAEFIADGMQIVVPNMQEARDLNRENDAKTDGRININTATPEMLCTLPGIGESRARDIIAYREKHGGFSKPEQIMEVSGIKQAVYEKIRDLITVGG